MFLRRVLSNRSRVYDEINSRKFHFVSKRNAHQTAWSHVIVAMCCKAFLFSDIFFPSRMQSNTWKKGKVYFGNEILKFVCRFQIWGPRATTGQFNLRFISFGFRVGLTHAGKIERQATSNEQQNQVRSTARDRPEIFFPYYYWHLSFAPTKQSTTWSCFNLMHRIFEPKLGAY